MRTFIIIVLVFVLIGQFVLMSSKNDELDILNEENAQLREEIRQMEEGLRFEYDEKTDQPKKIWTFDDIYAGEFKCYMDYRTITDKSSEQYALQQKAYTGPYGIRCVRDGKNVYYCVAMGSHFGTEIGQKYTVTMVSDNTFTVILADQKADSDTDDDNIADSDGCILEFLVDKEQVSDTVKLMGDVSYSDICFYGPIKSITMVKDGEML